MTAPPPAPSAPPDPLAEIAGLAKALKERAYDLGAIRYGERDRGRDTGPDKKRMDAAEAALLSAVKALVEERDALRGVVAAGTYPKALAAERARAERLGEALREVLASAVPHPVEHPTMFRAWERARAALSPSSADAPGEFTPAGREARDSSECAAVVMYRHGRDEWCRATPPGERNPCCTLKAGHRTDEHIAEGEGGILGRWPAAPPAPRSDAPTTSNEEP